MTVATKDAPNAIGLRLIIYDNAINAKTIPKIHDAIPLTVMSRFSCSTSPVT